MSDLEVRLDDGALWLTLNRPEHFNALTGEMVIGIIEQVRGATSRDDVRRGRAHRLRRGFLGGADLGGRTLRRTTTPDRSTAQTC